MRELPLILNGDAVLAVLAGRKTQTRRVLRLPKWAYEKTRDGGLDISWVRSIHRTGGGTWVPWSTNEPGLAEFSKRAYPGREGFRCPYGDVGDAMWVREAWRYADFEYVDDTYSCAIEYRADGENKLHRKFGGFEITDLRTGWQPSIHMPRDISRLTLEITATRVERLQDITPADVAAEGLAEPHTMEAFVKHFWSYTSWKKWPPDPWVYVREFRIVVPL